MIINNVAGFGDVLFCEPIYRKIWNEFGSKPFVLIHDHQMHLQEYIDSAVFIRVSKHQELKDKTEVMPEYIPLRYANQLMRGLSLHDHSDIENMMLDKYRMLGFDENLWKTIDINLVEPKIKINPNYLKKGYQLMNEFSQAGRIQIKPSDKIELSWWMVDTHGRTLIDWWWMIYNAKENHHVSTSTFFLMQAIKNKFPEWNAPCYIYPRPNEDGLRGISQLNPDFNIIRVK